MIQGKELSKDVIFSAGLEPDPMGSSGASVASQSWSHYKARGLAFCAHVLFSH